MDKPWLKSYGPGVPGHIEYPEIALPWLLRDAASEYPDGTATIFHGQRMAWREIDESAGRFASAITRLGIKKGDRIALFLPNCPQFVIALYGALMAGAVSVPFDPGSTEDDLVHFLIDSGAKTVVTLNLKRYYPAVTAVREATGLENIIVSSLRDYLPFPTSTLYPIIDRQDIAPVTAGNGVYLFHELLNDKPSAELPSSSHPEDTAVIVYNRGSVEMPQRISLTHRNLVANALQLRCWFRELEPGNNIFLTVLPLSQAFSLTTSLILPVAIGASMILLPRFEVKEVAEAIDYYKPSLFTGTAEMFDAINEFPDLVHYDLSSLRFTMSETALPEGVRRTFEKLTGGYMVAGYGIAGNGPLITCNPVDGERKGTGLPLPDTDCRIVDLETGERGLPPGNEGEFCVRGPQVPIGSNESDYSGWFRTGDIARMNTDGYFEVTGRKMELVAARKSKQA